jgi:hypothetical protein
LHCETGSTAANKNSGASFGEVANE